MGKTTRLLRALVTKAVLKSVKLLFSNKLGIECLTLYAFSTENWNRPKLEVETLMKVLINSKERVDHTAKQH
jgi:undecaprenyl diphosphate synthase